MLSRTWWQGWVQWGVGGIPTARPAKITQLESKLSITNLPPTVQTVLMFQVNVPMCKCLRQKAARNHLGRGWLSSCLSIKVYRHTATPTNRWKACGCFPATTAELRLCHRHCAVCKS